MSPFRSLARLLLAACALALPAAAQTTKHFLWEVASMTNRVYLYGTVHAGKKEWFPLPGPVEAAFMDAKILAVEADVTNVEAMGKTTSATTYEPPDSLPKHVSERDWERFHKLLPRYRLAESHMAQLNAFMAVSIVSAF